MKSILELISASGPGISALEIAKAMGHPYHENRQGASCDCIPSIQAHLALLIREQKVYKIGAYYWAK